jgi:hypothetical protein
MLVLRTNLTNMKDCIASIAVFGKLTGTYMALLHRTVQAFHEAEQS